MYKKFYKRFFDILFSVLALPFILILLLIISPIIYLSDKGSIFYNAQRLGRNGKVFKMYKFRSMKINAEDIRNEDGSTFNSESDSRLTRIGKFIRKTSIDETPQVINVLMGHMSFVGPRPDLPQHRLLYEDHENKKLSVRPGLTGFNQAYFRNTVPWKERIKNDLYYVDHLSLLLDVKIIIKTIVSILKKENIFNIEK